MGTEHIDRITHLLDGAHPIELEWGMDSYPRMHSTLQEIASRFHYPLEPVVAAFVEMSPASSYETNLRSLLTLLRARKRKVPLHRVKVVAYGACRDRAWDRLAEGGVERFLNPKRGAPKITNFFRNLVNPQDPHPITIDGHMYCIWVGRRMTLKQAVWEGFRYEEIADDFRWIARKRGMLANQVQGVCWFTWKRLHRILGFHRQLDLFRDPWRLKVKVQDINSYPFLPARVSHGYWRTPTYRTWEYMLTRCYNRKHEKWIYYGGRGITVCKEWREDFRIFLRDMGERPEGLTLDRKDPWGDYSPANCQWSTWDAQRRNRRSDYAGQNEWLLVSELSRQGSSGNGG